MSDPIPPSDIDAEQALLGSILIAPYLFDDLVAVVKAEYFYRDSHRWIWEAMNHLLESEQQIDQVTLCNALTTSGKLKEIGGPAYITGLINATPTSMHAESYAKIVREKAFKRKALEVATHLAQNAIQDKPLSEALQQMEEFFVSSSALSGATERMVMTAEKLCLSEMGELTWILKDWIMAGGINLIAGMPAAGKSFLALDLAIGMASSGLAWDNRPVTQGKVLYHFLDGSYRGMRSRVLKLCHARGIQPPADLIFDFSPLNLKVTSEVLALRQRIHRLDASVVIFDVMAKFMPGADENSVAEISPMMNTLREIANQTGTTFILIHHLNKGGNPDLSYRVRGSSDILGSVDTAIVVAHENQHSAHAMRTIIPQKVRESMPPAQLQFQIESTEESIALRFSETNASELVRVPGQAELIFADILEYLQSVPAQEFKKNELISALQINSSARTIDRAFSKLNHDPRIRVTKRGSFNTYQWEEDTPATPFP
ncbi:MAG TPA: AAA family ATPase [Anaerolineaceae bacterium]|nr:AAA family ATPase [Anaerolineaceae bacterium]